MLHKEMIDVYCDNHAKHTLWVDKCDASRGACRNIGI